CWGRSGGMCHVETPRADYGYWTSARATERSSRAYSIGTSFASATMSALTQTWRRLLRRGGSSAAAFQASAWKLAPSANLGLCFAVETVERLPHSSSEATSSH